ncbi:two-component sensor histidine kinase [Ramlibacter henchirensis]|uniref:histidine kinase n=1 Tax=Ramlibacter henchirensis TaxID=204072 RepID=A0A4Z0C8Y1_9BURK|nr:ATP-binding protein [Ramlibacter henchirensis]TFZ06529.1 two-component sensor histidine kinase [Ramlibacter henchirensis]
MHILSSGPMCSLRRALLFWLVPLFLLVGVASACFSYWTYNRMVASFMDEQMQQLGDSIALHDERVALPQVAPERAHKWGSYIAQVWNRDGLLEASSMTGIGAPMARAPGFHDVTIGGRQWRVYATSPAPGSGQRVQILQSGEFRRHLAVERAGSALAPVLILLPLAILILWGVAATLSREVQAIGRQAAQQDEHNIRELSMTRVPAEIAPLVESFNSLLSRLRDAFDTQRRFVQDAAHELRTPITAVALQLENVCRDMPAGACQESLGQLKAGVDRAQRLVDQLLKLSRNEAKAAQEPIVAVDLHAQVHQSIDGLIALADQRHIDLGMVVDSPVPTATLMLRCAAGDLRSALDNLIENALRYTPEGGVVDVRLSSTPHGPAIEVVDTGPGIPPDQLGRVFDRFFRVPGNGTRGSGLGLSIAQNAAQRCGLRIVLRNRQDRSGLVARIEPVAAVVPAASAAAPRTVGSTPVLAS